MFVGKGHCTFQKCGLNFRRTKKKRKAYTNTRFTGALSLINVACVEEIIVLRNVSNEELYCARWEISVFSLPY